MPGIIRLATEADAAAVQAIYAPYVRETAISFETEPPSVDEMRSRIQHYLHDHAYLVCEDTPGDLAGYAYASRFAPRAAYQWSAEVSIYARQDRRRQGIGRALYTPLLEMLRRQGCFNAYAGITLPNEGSIGLHRAMGFQPIGVYENVGYKFGTWHSVAWLGLTLLPHADKPPAPRPLHEAMSPEEVERLCADAGALLRF